MQVTEQTLNDVRICIHKGAKQIGGNCVEIVCEGKRLILDYGAPLDADENPEQSPTFVEGLDTGDSSILGVLISHPHRDHFGFINHVSEKIPVFMGQTACNILDTFSLFVPEHRVLHKNTHIYKDRMPFVLAHTSNGPIRVTPFLVDHSAYDSYSFLIEIGGKRIFYSGDFRFHGRKGILMNSLMKEKAIHEVDLLLLEGSSLGRLDLDAKFTQEQEIEEKFVETFKNTEGLALVHSSSQNIDRIVSIYHACCRTGRILLLDLYSACILKECFSGLKNRALFKNAALYVPERQRYFIKNNFLLDLLQDYSKPRIYRESILAEKSKYVLLFRSLHINDFERTPELLSGANYIYSMWNGYWSDNKYAQVRKFVEKNNLNKINIHTSGHACVGDLQTFVKNIGSPRITPIHTFQPEKYSDIFQNVEKHSDNEWFSL